MAKKKLLLTSTGGDCPGINAVIRAVVRSASPDWTILGSIKGYDGLMHEPPILLPLSSETVAGIHVKGGTILQTTNRADPLHWPVQKSDGTITHKDITGQLAERLRQQDIDALIVIGGDGSQKVAWQLAKKGVSVIGVPKTIDNDLSATHATFGFQTAVQTAVDCFDKLVSTAASHNRTMIMEVMGRDAGWIALHTAIAGGADVCLIPEIPYDIAEVQRVIEKRYQGTNGFANVVIAEGAKPAKSHEKTAEPAASPAYQLSKALHNRNLSAEIRETVLGHIQRGGSPVAFDRILATQFGVKAVEMIEKEQFGQMVSFSGYAIEAVPLEAAISAYKYVDPKNYLVETAKKTGISFGQID